MFIVLFYAQEDVSLVSVDQTWRFLFDYERDEIHRKALDVPELSVRLKGQFSHYSCRRK